MVRADRLQRARACASASDFTVSGSAKQHRRPTGRCKDAGGTKLQQTVQQMETTVETAAETTVSWFAQLFG